MDFTWRVFRNEVQKEAESHKLTDKLVAQSLTRGPALRRWLSRRNLPYIMTYATICTNIVAVVYVYPYGNTVNTVNTVNHCQPTIQPPKPPKPPNLLKLPKTHTVNTENKVKTYKLLITTIQMVQIMQLEAIFHVGTH